MSKTITIRDGVSQMRETVELSGQILKGEKWVLDLLAKNGCQVDDVMSDDAIESEVYTAWSGDGYDGDPSENGLSVSVSDAE